MVASLESELYKLRGALFGISQSTQATSANLPSILTVGWLHDVLTFPAYVIPSHVMVAWILLPCAGGQHAAENTQYVASLKTVPPDG